MYGHDEYASEVEVTHRVAAVHSWTIPIHDDPMIFGPWCDMFAEAAEHQRDHPDAQITVRFIEPAELVIVAVLPASE